MNVLLDESCRAAINLIEKNREFYPFAVALDTAGGVRHIDGYTGPEVPPSAEVTELMEEGLRKQASAGELLATAIAKDVRITDTETGKTTDAILVALEHVATDPITCYLPYSFEDDGLVEGDIAAEAGVRKIFGPGAQQSGSSGPAHARPLLNYETLLGVRWPLSHNR